MAKQATEGAETLPTPQKKYRLLDDVPGIFHVTITNRTYQRSELSDSDAEQLLALDWPGIERVK